MSEFGLGVRFPEDQKAMMVHVEPILLSGGDQRRRTSNPLRFIVFSDGPASAKTRKPWLRKTREAGPATLPEDKMRKNQRKFRNSQFCPFQNSANAAASRHRERRVGPKGASAVGGILPPNNQQTHPSPSSLPSRPPHASFAGHLGESVEDADQVIHKGGRSRVDSGNPRYVLLHICRNHLPSFPGPHTPAVHRPQDLNHLTHTRSCFSSLGSKRSLNSQEDVPELKRRRTGLKKFRPAAPETEAAQSSSSPAVSVDDESELAALRQTLQQVQEDLSVLQKDQRQPDDITRSVQRDLDEARPRDTLRFLEEHFTCAL